MPRLVAPQVDEVGPVDPLAVPDERVGPVPLVHAEVFVKVVGDRAPGDQLPAHALLQALDLDLRGARSEHQRRVPRVQVRVSGWASRPHRCGIAASLAYCGKPWQPPAGERWHHRSPRRGREFGTKEHRHSGRGARHPACGADLASAMAPRASRPHFASAEAEGRCPQIRGDVSRAEGQDTLPQARRSCHRFTSSRGNRAANEGKWPGTWLPAGARAHYKS